VLNRLFGVKIWCKTLVLQKDKLTQLLSIIKHTTGSSYFCPVDTVLGRICSLFFSSFVQDLRCKIHFHEIWHRHSASVPNFTINFSEVKVKVRGQNRHTENLPLVAAQPSFKTSSPNVATVASIHFFLTGGWAKLYLEKAN